MLQSPTRDQIDDDIRSSWVTGIGTPKRLILLLHRVQTSTSFPSAQVFPGGHLSATQDEDVPGPMDEGRHRDGEAYRVAAIRECFEESGILLAKERGKDALLQLEDSERERGRRAIHGNEVLFKQWVKDRNGTIDTANLIPFTRWLTPVEVPKRHSTQMYLYFLPLRRSATNVHAISPESIIPTPTADGGIEHTAARFLSASEWLALADSSEVVLFPPQYFLLHLVAPFLTSALSSSAHAATSSTQTFPDDAFQRQRERLLAFLRNDGDPPWTEKCICPREIFRLSEDVDPDRRIVYALDHPGPELEEGERRGDIERVILVHYQGYIPSRQEIRWRTEIEALKRKSDEVKARRKKEKL